jgi:DNA-binding MarR family transcriptional regulator
MKRKGNGIELLADPTRRRIIAALAVRPRRPASLARDLAISRPALSPQLRLLAEAGLIWWSPWLPDGRARPYTISPTSHGIITAWLAGTEIGATGLGLRLQPDGRVEIDPTDDGWPDP